jgi:hypothetical protein
MGFDARSGAELAGPWSPLASDTGKAFDDSPSHTGSPGREVLIGGARAAPSEGTHPRARGRLIGATVLTNCPVHAPASARTVAGRVPHTDATHGRSRALDDQPGTLLRPPPDRMGRHRPDRGGTRQCRALPRDGRLHARLCRPRRRAARRVFLRRALSVRARDAMGPS